MTQLDLFAPSTITALRAIAAAELARVRAAIAARVRRGVLAHLGRGKWGERDYNVAQGIEHEPSVRRGE